MADRLPLIVVGGDLMELPAADDVSPLAMPRVSNAIRSGSVVSSLTSDAASGAGNLINIGVGGDITVNASTNPTDWQELRHHFVAVGADRKVTFAGGYGPSVGVHLGPYKIPRGAVLVTRSEYVGNRANASDQASPAWVLTEAHLTDSSGYALEPPSNMNPALHAAVAWTLDPIDLTGGTSMTVTGGVIYLFKIELARPVLASGVTIRIQTAGATQTAGQVGIYDAAGNLLASSAQQTTAWQTTGDKNVPFSAVAPLPPGEYYIAFLSAGTTPARPLSTGSPTAPNIRLAAGAYRTATFGTGQSALPATITPASQGAGTQIMLALLY